VAKSLEDEMDDVDDDDDDEDEDEEDESFCCLSNKFEWW